MAEAAQLQSLLQTKAALQLGLVSQEDYDEVKKSFLQAQKIKSAVDVGLIKPEDYEATKQSFLALLTGAAAAPSPTAAAAAAAAAPQAAPPPPSPRPAPVAWQLPPPAPPKVAAAAQQAKADAAASASSAAAPAAADGGGGSAIRRVPSNPNVPTNIPRMGGIKKMAQGTSMSGIQVTDDAVNLFYVMRLKSTYKWALWQVDDSGSQVIIAAVGEKDSTYEDFLAALPDADCRYGVFDFDFTTDDGQKLHKMIFLNWAPDAAKVKSKMMYASTKEFFKTHLDGISLEFQASDLEEVSEEEVGDAVRALKRG